ncbi:MAG: hypothetical protein OXF75_10410 [Acidimicrobiaceae bacterium]|nr:hypothetical protein [Acidimicrobiaceae bacterium]
MTDVSAPNASTGVLAPWGSPPTPVIPRWYFQTRLAQASLPPLLRQFASPQAGFRDLLDLAGIWERRSEPLTKTEHRALAGFAHRLGQPPYNHAVIPAGVDGARLLELPLRVRTLNCLRRALHAGRLSTGDPVQVGHLMALTNFGFVSLLDVMCLVESANDCGFLTSPPAPAVGIISAPRTAPLPPLDPKDPVRKAASDGLAAVLAATREVNGSRTLTEALNGDLGELVSVMGLAESFAEIDIDDLTEERSLAQEMLAKLAEFWESLNEVERTVLVQRVLATQPSTFEQLSRQLSLSRERIRQIAKKLRVGLHEPETSTPGPAGWAAALAMKSRRQLGPIAPVGALDELIATAFSPFESAENGGGAEVVELARSLLRTKSGYSCAGGFCFDRTAVVVIDALKSASLSLADDVGLVEERALKEHLPDESWHQHWDTLVDQCQMTRINGCLALRDSQKARAKEALLCIGRPATKEEVAELSGLAPGRVSSQFSTISSVVRADKKRWGLAEWVEDEYEGIPAEIIQRINEDGGATRLERLLEELPRLFGVAEGSVLAYANSPRFRISEGHVSLADPSSIRLRDLEDVIHGRTVEGLPYWSFKVESRYFRGYSLAGLPAEIAKALGCEPDGRLRVPVGSPQGCDPVSVNWPLSSLTGANLGYLSVPLTKLGAQSGDRVLLALGASGAVSLRLVGEQPQAEEQARSVTAPVDAVSHATASDRSDRAADLLERMIQRRRRL